MSRIHERGCPGLAAWDIRDACNCNGPRAEDLCGCGHERVEHGGATASGGCSECQDKYPGHCRRFKRAVAAPSTGGE